MSLSPTFAKASERAAPPATSPSSPRSERPRERARLLAVCALMAGALVPASYAEVPGAPTDAAERVWYTSFMTRFNARVRPSFSVDPEIQSRVVRVWDAMVMRVTELQERQASPLDQYPLLSFVDDRFVVMKARTPRGEDTFVVRSQEALAMPTLTSTLVDYLDR